MTTSKSPRRVMAEAYAAAQKSLPAYSHKFSPKKFTQHQLLACLVLKEHQKKDYRGVVELLADCSDLRQVIGLEAVPHFTTLQKAGARLLSLPRFRKLLDRTVRRVLGRRTNVPYAAGDSTGFESGHASRYYVSRRDNQTARGEDRPKKRVSYARYGKLMLIVCCASHAVLAAVASAGPSPDIDQPAGVVAELNPATARVGHLVLDAGFDSAANHRLLREGHGIRSTIPPGHGRRPKDPRALPADPYRRMMKQRFRNGRRPEAYRRRPQVETSNSMIKRNLGSALAGRSYQARRRDMLLKVLAHNCMLMFLWVFYRAGITPKSA